MSRRKYKCPTCGFKVTADEYQDSEGPLCEGDNWPHVDRGRHPREVMEPTLLSRWL